jgi:hypothetical protein
MSQEEPTAGMEPPTPDAPAAPEQVPAFAGPEVERTSVGRWFWEWTKSILVAFLLFIFVRTFIVEAFQIPTASMENTLLVGDFLLVNKMVYGAEIPGTNLSLPSFDEPDRGDVVVFEPPPQAGQPPRTNYVKRIVGVPGDTLRIGTRWAARPIPSYAGQLGTSDRPGRPVLRHGGQPRQFGGFPVLGIRVG